MRVAFKAGQLAGGFTFEVPLLANFLAFDCSGVARGGGGGGGGVLVLFGVLVCVCNF